LRAVSLPLVRPAGNLEKSNAMKRARVDTPAHPVLALEAQRCKALQRGEMALLEGIFADPMTYVHSTGVVHDRAECLEHLRDKMRFMSVERCAMDVTHWGSIALCTGLMRQEGRRIADNDPFTSVSFVTQAWTNHGSGWRLSLMQSTRVDEALWSQAQTTSPVGMKHE
jgi:hypothetical protein